MASVKKASGDHTDDGMGFVLGFLGLALLVVLVYTLWRPAPLEFVWKKFDQVVATMYVEDRASPTDATTATSEASVDLNLPTPPVEVAPQVETQNQLDTGVLVQESEAVTQQDTSDQNAPVSTKVFVDFEKWNDFKVAPCAVVQLVNPSREAPRAVKEAFVKQVLGEICPADGGLPTIMNGVGTITVEGKTWKFTWQLPS